MQLLGLQNGVSEESLDATGAKLSTSDVSHSPETSMSS